MKTLHVLFTARTAVTGRALTAELQSIAPADVRVTGSTGSSRPVNFLVRWGNSSSVDYEPEEVFQDRQAVANTSDKLAMLECFKADNVPCPKWYRHDEFSRITRFPIVVRKRDHFKGQGFWTVNNRQELQRFASSRFYAVEIIDVAHEYRVFVYNGKIMEINKKIQDNRPITAGLNPLIKNHTNGWVCRRGGFEVPEGIRHVAKYATEALGLDFSACDVYVDRNGNKGLFEANTAPGLVERKIEKLARKIMSQATGEEMEVEL